MAKLDKSKLASGRIQTNMGALPSFSKPRSTSAAEEKKESVKAAEPPAEEKKAPEEEKRPVETKPEAKPVPSVSVQESPEKKAEEKRADDTPKVATVTHGNAKRGRGRPPIHAKTLDEQGQPLTNLNVLLSDELHRYLHFVTSMSGKKSKAAYVRDLIQNNYEKNFEKFRQWEKSGGDDFLS